MNAVIDLTQSPHREGIEELKEQVKSWRRQIAEVEKYLAAHDPTHGSAELESCFAEVLAAGDEAPTADGVDLSYDNIGADESRRPWMY